MKQTNLLEETIKILKKQLTESLASENALKAQVDLYSSKYGEFTKTFQGYKTDMTKMSKKTFKMEKEMLQWKIKYEKANAMLLDLVSEKQVRDEHITKTAKQLFQLQKLCRTLSAEKKAFYSKLIECNIELPEVKEFEIPEMNEPVVSAVVAIEKDNAKLELMSKNCDELKKNLAQLQGQLTAIGDPEQQVSSVAASGKKGKSKKSKKNLNTIENGNIIADKESVTSQKLDIEAALDETPTVTPTEVTKAIEPTDIVHEAGSKESIIATNEPQIIGAPIEI